MYQYHARGIILKMIGDDRQLGSISLKCGPGHSIKTSWVSNVMCAYHFHQIHAALHPEMGPSTVGDHCHQLCAFIVSLNPNAKQSFILGRQRLFDEGGIASKSRYNPVGQYNSLKPDKYGIDLFVLVKASEGKKLSTIWMCIKATCNQCSHCRRCMGTSNHAKSSCECSYF